MDNGVENSERRRWVGLVVLLAAIFVATLDNFIVFVAIPSIRSDLNATFSEAEFIVAGYTLAFALGLITSGRLGDKFGRRRMFLIGFSAFTVASGLCGLAPSGFALIVFRIIQGLAGAVLSPQVLAIIRTTFVDPRHRASAFAWMGVAIGLGGILGQVLGGVVISANFWGLEWRPVFLINLPVGVFALLLGPFVLEESRAGGPQQLDVAGAILISIGLGLLLFPLIQGREEGWPAWSIVMLLTSIPVLISFAAHQFYKTAKGASPLVNTDLFKDRTFSLGLLLVLLFFGTISPFVLSFSYLVQIGFNYSPFVSALYFSPMAITFVVTNISVGRLGTLDAPMTLRMGAILSVSGMAITYAATAFIPDFTPMEAIPGLAVLGIGQGLFMTPIVNAVLAEISPDNIGAASGVLNTMQRVGNAMGVALLEIPFFHSLAQARDAGENGAATYTHAFGTVTLVLTALLALVFGLLQLLFRDKERVVGAPK